MARKQCHFWKLPSRIQILNILTSFLLIQNGPQLKKMAHNYNKVVTMVFVSAFAHGQLQLFVMQLTI